ncbi:unnamed protein product [Hermetia illucens]|uniref:Uncharacterized protein n=1 Tax=Hermetia illucens TaxID=343691 RepID=A0A7R8YLP6_HERIL|nr:unnamed protein product [Hermetia illucens]
MELTPLDKISTIKGKLEKCLQEKEQLLQNLVKSSIPGYYVKQDKFLLKNIEILSEEDIQRRGTELDRLINKLEHDLRELETDIWQCYPQFGRVSTLSSGWLPIMSSETDPSIEFIPVPFFSKERDTIMFHLISPDGKCYISNAGKDGCIKTVNLPIFEITLLERDSNLQFVPIPFFSEELKKVMFILISTDGRYYIKNV